MKILSIIVPSYNTSAFIDKNIPTLLDQRILEELEVLIINDGSKDNTAEIAQKYADRYPQTVKVVSKENGGHGSVINKGIEIATGKYFKVIDGDDWVEKDSLYKLISKLKKSNSDLIINPYHIVYENNKKRKLIKFEAPQYGKKLQFEKICSLYQKLPIHSITYKTSLLRENGIRVREHCFYEDNEYDLFPIPYVKTATVLRFSVYQYLMDQKNQSVSDANSLKNDSMFCQVVFDCMDMYDQKKDSLSENIDGYIKNTILELVRSQYNIYLRNGFSDGAYYKFEKFNKMLKDNREEYYIQTGNRYKYIKLLQTENKFIYLAFSTLIKIYKNI